jgi:hypothetical protein
MEEPIVYKCVMEGCKDPVSISSRSFLEHSRSHRGPNVSKRAVRRMVDRVMNAFSARVGQELWWKDVEPLVKWNTAHPSAKEIEDREEAKARLGAVVAMDVAVVAPAKVVLPPVPTLEQMHLHKR